MTDQELSSAEEMQLERDLKKYMRERGRSAREVLRELHGGPDNNPSKPIRLGGLVAGWPKFHAADSYLRHLADSEPKDLA